jgi:hypothetical protein
LFTAGEEHLNLNKSKIRGENYFGAGNRKALIDAGPDFGFCSASGSLVCMRSVR